ncbi:Esa1p-associated factor [Geranomyces variabilis]|uniref:Chromatin modification-related protein EAF3 n=1 Tax=Geranomyces variabilis TaxID=109894 RepID=A0AAD5TKQ4_9FUNG|nr:Esa1p-associated factor [Geranomyces variabilis]
MSDDLTFDVSEKVLCFHGPLLYEARIIDREVREAQGTNEAGPYYKVHYQGWKRTWDEWVPETRILKFTDDNLQKQQDLRASLNIKAKEKKAAEKDEAGGASGDKKGRKRPRDDAADKEQEFLVRPEIKLAMPESLKAQLVEDWENVTKNHRLVRVPRDVTVADILARYKESTKDAKGKRAAKDTDLLQEVLDGIQTYFDRSLANLLLYRFERQQYVEIKKKYPKTGLSEVYGAEHLLRLFVQFPSLIAHTNMESEAVGLLKDHLTKILEFMQAKKSELFLAEYDNVNPSYMKQMAANG